MFNGLLELIKDTHPEILKRVLVELVASYSDVEKTVTSIERQIKENQFFKRNDSVRITYENLLNERILKIDGKIELLEEIEEWLKTGFYEPTPVTENVIDIMLFDYKNRFNDALSETLKMYYGIKIDTLKELKNQL